MATVVPNTPRDVATRLLFIDNIRWCLIVVVICHHSAVTYGQVGSWYDIHFATPSIFTKALLGTFTAFNQAYFMGFLFLLAGYFVPIAYDSKGFARFVRDRAIRLGIPAAFFMLVIQPVIVYWLLREFYEPSRPPLARAYKQYISSGRVLSGSGPMWFAVALLLFCVAYSLTRLLSADRRQVSWIPGNASVFGLILIMGTCSFVVRIWQPVNGTNFFNMQLGNFSQYILLFAVGILAYRGNWLMRIEHSFGIVWMRLALGMGSAAFITLILTSGVLKGDQRMFGGINWPSAAYCYWEAFFCLGMCLGLTVIFRDRFNRQGPFSRWMSRNSFSAYLFHTPLLISVTLGLEVVAAPPLAKFALASLLAVPLSFVVGGLIRERVPGLSRLL